MPEVSPSEPFASPYVPKPDSLRDTIESVVIAFIFAFVFRAFVVEAFVIPTGSMAPTLYGLHGQHRCASCNYPYAYGLREDTRPQYQLKPLNLPCPNCGWDGAGNDRDNATPDANADAGDRILVLKWPYDIGGPWLKPQRWDVVVFKDPQDGVTNFIKRLVGLPGEVLEIIDGDIYTCPASSISPGLAAELAKKRPPFQSGGPDFQHLTEEHYRELNQKLTIARKTRVAQDSLWLIHYDHDFPPTRDDRFRGGDPHWDPPHFRTLGLNGESPWKTDSPRITFTPTDQAPHSIVLAGQAVQDRYGYNPPVQTGAPETVNVGDVRLRFLFTPRGGEGQFSMTLTKGDDVFRATLRPGGQVTLDKILPEGVPKQQAEVKVDPFEAGKPVEVSYCNLDYRIALSIDGQEVLATRDNQYQPDLARLRRLADGKAGQAKVEMTAQGWPLELQHVAIDRDVFYRSTRDALGAQVLTQPNGPQFNPYGNIPGWATTNYPILLRGEPGDYFCCGDNSPQSKDGRMWVDIAPMLATREGAEAYQFGTVPADQMIGRAFFVYWPSGFKVFSSRVGVIPNVGRMRIIR